MKKIIKVVPLLLVILVSLGVFLFIKKSVSKQVLDTTHVEIGWIKYEGNNFSFIHPVEWEDQTNMQKHGSKVIEDVFYKVPKSNGFDANLSSANFDEIKAKNTEAVQTTIGGKQAIRIQVDGPNAVMPKGDSSITYFIKGNGGTTFTISLDITRSEVPDEIINKVISSFQFKD